MSRKRKRRSLVINLRPKKKRKTLIPPVDTVVKSISLVDAVSMIFKDNCGPLCSSEVAEIMKNSSGINVSCTIRNNNVSNALHTLEKRGFLTRFFKDSKYHYSKSMSFSEGISSGEESESEESGEDYKDSFGTKSRDELEEGHELRESKDLEFEEFADEDEINRLIVIDHIERILVENNTPMTCQELYNKLKEEGIISLGSKVHTKKRVNDYTRVLWKRKFSDVGRQFRGRFYEYFKKTEEINEKREDEDEDDIADDDFKEMEEEKEVDEDENRKRLIIRLKREPVEMTLEEAIIRVLEEEGDSLSGEKIEEEIENNINNSKWELDAPDWIDQIEETIDNLVESGKIFRRLTIGRRRGRSYVYYVNKKRMTIKIKKKKKKRSSSKSSLFEETLPPLNVQYSSPQRPPPNEESTVNPFTQNLGDSPLFPLPPLLLLPPPPPIKEEEEEEIPPPLNEPGNTIPSILSLTSEILCVYPNCGSEVGGNYVDLFLKIGGTSTDHRKEEILDRFRQDKKSVSVYFGNTVANIAILLPLEEFKNIDFFREEHSDLLNVNQADLVCTVYAPRTESRGNVNIRVIFDGCELQMEITDGYFYEPKILEQQQQQQHRNFSSFDDDGILGMPEDGSQEFLSFENLVGEEYSFQGPVF